MDSDLQVTEPQDDIRASLESAFESAETQEVAPAEETTEVKATRERDETGKFKAKEVVPEVAVEAQKEEAPIVKPSPKSLKKELADKHWSTLDPELQDALLQRDDDFAKGIEGYKSKADGHDKFMAAISPYMATINQFGVSPDVAVGELLKSDHTLRYGNEQQKVGMVLSLFKDYGINPQAVFNQLQNGVPQVNPEISPIYQELQSTKQQVSDLVRAQQDRENLLLTSEIEKVKEGKEHFDLVRDDMAALLQANRAKDLEQAYEMAIWARPDLRATLLQQEREKAQSEATQKAQAQRSQAAGVSVKGSSPSATTATTTNLRELISSQF